MTNLAPLTWQDCVQPDWQVYSVITIDLLTRSSEIDDQARFVPDVVAAAIVPICGST